MGVTVGCDQPGARGRSPLACGTLQWLATDTGDDADAWFIERRADGATWKPGTQQADVTVSGPARSLLLVLTRRLPLSDTSIRVDGPSVLAQHWLDNTVHASG